jgi:hypothetical protein
VVIGATMTVRRCAFSSSGDTTRQGRVFWISLPSVGSRRPAGSGAPGSLDNEPSRLCVQLDFVGQLRLIQKIFGTRMPRELPVRTMRVLIVTGRHCSYGRGPQQALFQTLVASPMPSCSPP